MTQSKSNFKKVSCLLISIMLAFGALFMFAGCQTSHPNAKITVTFNSQDYVLNYKLYRNMYPKTVQRFIELADKDYYDDTTIHSFGFSADARMFVGGYAWDSQNNSLTEKELPLGLTQSVFKSGSKDGVNTIYGEFYNNGYEVQNNPVKQEYGSLTMYYASTNVDITDETVSKVDVIKSNGETRKNADFVKNNATGTFYISTSKSTSTKKDYCTFALLNSDDDSDKLEELITAIDTYFKDTYGDEDYYNLDEAFDVSTDYYKAYDSFYIPKTAITIKTVEITKH